MSLVERLAAALALAGPGDLLPGDLHDNGNGGPLREAAVLVAITDRAEPGVILTQRRADLRDHGGQISFPLREAWEELALDPAAVHVVGEVDHYRTVTGFGVTPVIGVIPPDLVLTANPAEVADWFEAPLGHLLDPANHVRRSVHFRGADRTYFEIMWNGRQIWGATAAMLVNLSRRLRWS